MSKKNKKRPNVAAPAREQAKEANATESRAAESPTEPGRSTESHASSQLRSTRAARAAVLLGALAAYVGVLDNGLVRNWDDERFLSDPDVLHPSLGGLVGFFTEVRFDAYHPLHLLSYWIDVPWVGVEGPLAATVLHAVNLVLWLGVLAVGFEVMRKLGLTPLAAAVATLAFGIHPLTVEVVAWASARKDILAMGFGLGAVLAHLSISDHGGKGEPRSSFTDRNAWISRGLFVLAALSKTSILTLPLGLVLIDLWTRRRSAKDALIVQAPSLGLAAAFGVVVILVWRSHDMIRNAGTDAAPFDPMVVPATVFHLLQTSVWPANLSPMYPLLRHDALPWWYGVVAVSMLVMAIGVAYRDRQSLFAARVGLGLTLFLVLSLPVLNLVPTFFQWQDRYGVAPLFGLAFLVGAGIDALRTTEPRETLIRVLVTSVVVLLPLGWLTTSQVEAWRDQNHLWGVATRRHPRAYYAWLKLGETRRERGDLEAALRAYAEAIEIAPEIRLAHGAFVYTLALRDEADQGIAPSQALTLSQRYLLHADDADALRTLSSEMVDAGYRDAATYALGRSLDLDPVADERIEHAISFHLAQRNIWLARFYLSRMTRRPYQRDVTAFWEAERERLGLITDEEREAMERGETGGGPPVIPLGLPSEEMPEEDAVPEGSAPGP